MNTHPSTERPRFFPSRVPLILALACLGFGGCQSHPTLYWAMVDPDADAGKPGSFHALMRVRLDEDPLKPERILEPVDASDPAKPQPRVPSGIAVTRDAERIYWAEPQSRRIKTASLAERKTANFPADLAVRYPVAVALDEEGHRLFWAGSGVDGPLAPGTIACARTDGPDKTITILYEDRSISGASGIALDARAGHRRVYWLTSTGHLQSIDMDGKETQPTDVGTVRATEAHGLAYVPAQEKLFWADYGVSRIGWARLQNGRVAEQGGIDLTHPWPISVSVDLRAGRLYWGYRTSRDAGIEWMNLDGDPMIHTLPFKTTASGIEVVYTR